MFQVNESLMMQLGCKLKVPSHFLTVVKCDLNTINMFVLYWVIDTSNSNKLHQVKLKIT